MSAPPLTQRPERVADLPFLRELYESTRADELAAFGWSTAELDAFVDLQFRAQHGHYRAVFPDADYLVLLRGSDRVGRLYVDRAPGEIRLIDIALLPAHRGAGHGTRLVRELVDEATATRRPLRLSVDPRNRAVNLYRRLGFTIVADQGTSALMQWGPPPPAEGGRHG